MENDQPQIFGTSEKMTDESFVERNTEKKRRIKSKLPCKEFLPYEWAEYKSSLLMVFLYENSKNSVDLKLFMHKMIINITDVLDLDLHLELINYITEVKTANQKEIARVYPVSQSQLWIKNQNTAGLWDDIYGLINFTRWLWEQINTLKYYNTVTCGKSSLNHYLLLKIFQEQMFQVQNALKGPRLNNNTSNNVDKTLYVGISPFRTKVSEKRVNSLPDAIIKPWIHPGAKQCFIPYFGGYGAMIKSYRDSKNPSLNAYSSLQCGISGSVNFFIFLYLLSTTIVNDKDIKKSLYRLILVISLQLVGDGGHNFRETICGITEIAIVLKNVIQDIKEELASHYRIGHFQDNINAYMNDPNYAWSNNIGTLGLLIRQYMGPNGLSDKIINCKGVNALTVENVQKQVFVTFLTSLVNWEKSILQLYEITAGINVVGFDDKDFTKLNIAINNETFNQCKEETYKVFFGVDKQNTDNITQTNRIQVFFALDKSRFLLDKKQSFQGSADLLLNTILQELYPTLKERVDREIDAQYMRCNQKSSDIYIPYA